MNGITPDQAIREIKQLRFERPIRMVDIIRASGLAKSTVYRATRTGHVSEDTRASLARAFELLVAEGRVPQTPLSGHR